ncbi:MAG: HU family DNA-binding protein [Candidatus Aminicenantaceae bacterium]
MNKREATKRMSRDAGITGLQAEKAFNSLIQGIKNSLKKGKRVTFSGFGTFDIKSRKARQGRNPRTGEIISIPKKKTVKFIPSKSLIGALVKFKTNPMPKK